MGNGRKVMGTSENSIDNNSVLYKSLRFNFKAVYMCLTDQSVLPVRDPFLIPFLFPSKTIDIWHEEKMMDWELVFS